MEYYVFNSDLTASDMPSFWVFQDQCMITESSLLWVGQFTPRHEKIQLIGQHNMS